MITVDLERNPKQYHFVQLVLAAAFGDVLYRYLFYGGAIRGGKTVAGLSALILLCKIFPNSRWYVLRKSFARLQETSIPSMQKLLGQSPFWKWNQNPSHYYVEHLPTGARIYFAGENIATDPDLKWMLGLECNGFLLEQCEELAEKTFNMAMSRTGSWILPLMPMGLILATFNPTQTWVKQRVYDVWRDGLLEPPYYFEEARAEDNAFNTADQYEAWARLPDEMRAQFVDASWEFSKPPNVFAYAFNEKPAILDVHGRRIGGGHHRDVGYNSDLGPLYLSFDFNVEPITCLAAQHDLDWIHVVKEYRLLVSDIWALTDHIVAHVPEAYFMVTGDASGRNRSALTRGNHNYYHVIRQQLALGPGQQKVPKANPLIRNTRVLCNALLQKHPRYFVNTKACPHLTVDLNSVEVITQGLRAGELDEGKDKRKGHLLAGFRYYNWTFHRDFLDKNLYQYVQTA